MQRNKPCPCGSGQKYKRCCLKTATLHRKSEPLFIFEPGENIQEIVAHQMTLHGFPRANVYAFRKTGFVIDYGNRHLLKPADAAEWDAAVAEYHQILQAELPAAEGLEQLRAA